MFPGSQSVCAVHSGASPVELPSSPLDPFDVSPAVDSPALGSIVSSAEDIVVPAESDVTSPTLGSGAVVGIDPLDSSTDPVPPVPAESPPGLAVSFGHPASTMTAPRPIVSVPFFMSRIPSSLMQKQTP
jgi:hypothetical protein